MAEDVGPMGGLRLPPDPPPGFEIDAPSAGAPPPPSGFVIDQPQAAAPSQSYWETYNQMRREAQEQIGKGVEQVKGASNFGDVDTGVTGAALGALGYVGSPINAAIRQYVSQPLENKTGLPKEYTETAAALLPMGPKRAPSMPRPNFAEIKGAASQGYKAADEAALSVAVPEQAFRALETDLKSTLHAAGERANVKPIYDAIDAHLPKEAGDVKDLMNLRADLRQMGGQDGAVAAKLVLPKIENSIESLAPGTMATIRRADAGESAARVAQRIDKRFNRAENLQGGIPGDRIRNAAQSELNAPSARFLHPEDRAALTALNEGTAYQNTLQGASKALNSVPFHIGLGMPTLGAANLPLWAASKGMRGLYNRSVANQAQGVQNAVAMRSPMYQARLAAHQRALAAQQELAAAQQTAKGLLGGAIAAPNASLLGP